jgi:hypothetical protein
MEYRHRTEFGELRFQGAGFAEGDAEFELGIRAQPPQQVQQEEGCATSGRIV